MEVHRITIIALSPHLHIYVDTIGTFLYNNIMIIL